MKVRFGTNKLRQLYELDKLGGKQKYPSEIISQYRKKVDILISIENISELRNFASLNFESLKGDRKGQFSIRLNRQYRLLFEQLKNKEGYVVVKVLLINEISKHYE